MTAGRDPWHAHDTDVSCPVTYIGTDCESAFCRRSSRIACVGSLLVTAFESQGMLAPNWQASTAPFAQTPFHQLALIGPHVQLLGHPSVGSFGPVYRASGLSIVPTALQSDSRIGVGLSGLSEDRRNASRTGTANNIFGNFIRQAPLSSMRQVMLRTHIRR